MTDENRPRGRPRRDVAPHTEASNRIIARTVHRLLMRGFALRTRENTPGAAECVGELAKEILHRTCPAGKALGPDQIEKIFETWVKVEQEERRLAKKWPLPMPSWYTKESLSQGRSINPTHLPALAREFLKNGGESRPMSAGSLGDLALTPSRQKTLGDAPKFESPTYEIACRALGNEISDEAWEAARKLLPPDKVAGRPRKWSERDILNAILHMQKNNCTWRELPSGFPPWKTVHSTYLHWRENGILEGFLNALATFPDKI